MTKKNVSVFSLIMLLMLPLAAAAQNSTSSPYSIFGIGLLTPKEDVASAGMGHAAIGLTSNEWVNVSNPAASCGLDSMSFYFNLQLKGFYGRVENINEHQSTYSLNLDGVTMGFRCNGWWTMALGYSPYSTVGYNMSERKWIIGDDVKYRTQYSGSGGLQQGYVSTAFTLFRHFTVGASVSALWGSITKTETALFDECIGGENIYNTRKYTMNNLFFEYGFQYDFNIGQCNFRIGGVFSDKTKLYSSYDHIVSNDVSSELFFDDVTPLREQFYVPRSYGAGFSFSRKRLTIAADWKKSEWSNIVNSKFGESVLFIDGWKAGGGVEFRAGSANQPFYKRLRYRAGYCYTKDYMKMRGVNLDCFGIDLGLTIPFGKSSNAISLAYEYSQRGTKFNGMVREKVQSLKVSMNIRETWFMKAKFN